MLLKDYLISNEITQADFARLIGASAQVIERYVNKKRIPKDEDTMKLIVAATGGQVTANDFYGIEHAPPIPGHGHAVN